MPTAVKIIGVLLLLSTIEPLWGQSNKVEHIQFYGNRMDNPIEIIVLKTGNEYTFYAENRSYYPYTLELKINNIINLLPAYFERQFKIVPGKNTLTSLKIKNPDYDGSYNYSYKYTIGLIGNKVDLNFPYLIPIKDSFNFGNTKKIFFRNNFILAKQDTIYCMRKGLVAATPDMYHNSDRISNSQSLEIIHSDGTIMVYENLNPDKVFVKPGNTIYPGEALGIINHSLDLKVNLYNTLDQNSIQNIDIYYYTGDGSTSLYSKELLRAKVTHPESIITKEMTKMELKKYKKGKLMKTRVMK